MVAFYYALREAVRSFYLMVASSGDAAKGAISISLRNIDLERRMIDLRTIHKGETKRGWITFFSEETGESLRRYLAERPRGLDEPVFPFSTQLVYKVFKQAGKATRLSITL